jgi:hypothetical protein
MADQKITELTLGHPLADDIIPYVSDPGGSAVTKKTLVGSIGDSPSCSRGLVGTNNTGTPTTKFDFSADLVELRNPTTGGTHVVTSTGTITCDITLPAAGATPTANGCDQSKISALTSRWVHFYFIWNGTAIATIASLTAPPTGPAFPSGYTKWCYIGAIRLNGSSQLIPSHLRANNVYYRERQAAVNAGTQTVETAVDISAIIPPNAQNWQGTIDNIIGVSNASGAVTLTTFVRVFTGLNWIVAVMALTGLGNAQTSQVTGPSWIAPNIGQNFYYLHSISPGTSPSANIFVLSYSMPNGGS